MERIFRVQTVKLVGPGLSERLNVIKESTKTFENINPI